MPKVELHRHFEGSLRLETLVEVARDYGIEMPEYDIETLRPFVQVMPDEPRNSKHFLSKFAVVRQFYRTRELIQRYTREIVEDAALDNVRYMELRFTPRALCNITGCPADEIVQMVCETGNAAAEEFGIKVRYIISINRHEGVDLGEQALRAALKNLNRGVVGLDLGGDEANFSCLPFRHLFRRAKAAGLGITIHAGEWAGAGSVWDAVGNLGADRVGHGIRVLQDPGMVQILIDREIVLEVCPTSNYLSGIVDSLEDHPLLDLTRLNVKTTLNTDDPLLCDVTLTQEIVSAMEMMKLSVDEVKQYTLRAARAAFLPEEERIDLVRELQQALAVVE